VRERLESIELFRVFLRMIVEIVEQEGISPWLAPVGVGDFVRAALAQ